MGRERRRDPRTDHLYSLRNLLRVSAEKYRIPLLVLGTDDDIVIAASGDLAPRRPGQAEEVLLRGSRQRVDAQDDHTRLRFAVQGQTLTLVACGAPTGNHGAFPGLLESVLLQAIAQRVESIFAEPVRAPLPLLAGACA